MPSPPPSTEARVRTRRWLAGEQARYAALHRVAAGREVDRLAAGLTRTRDQRRCGLALQRLLGPHAASVFVTDKPPMVVALSFRMIFPIGPADRAADEELQAAVYCFGFGDVRREPGARVYKASGPWTTSFKQHAIRRLCDRSPSSDITTTLLQAHDAVIAAESAAAVAGHDNLYLTVGPGAFIGKLGRATLAGADAGLAVVISTFLNADMMRDNQLARMLPTASAAASALGARTPPLTRSIRHAF